MGEFLNLLLNLGDLTDEAGNPEFGQQLIQVVMWIFIVIGGVIVPFAIYLAFRLAYAGSEQDRNTQKKRLLNVIITIMIIGLLIAMLGVVNFTVMPGTGGPGHQPGAPGVPPIGPGQPGGPGGPGGPGIGGGGHFGGSADAMPPFSAGSWERVNGVRTGVYNATPWEIAFMSRVIASERMDTDPYGNQQGTRVHVGANVSWQDQFAIAEVMMQRVWHFDSSIAAVLTGPTQWSAITGSGANRDVVRNGQQIWGTTGSSRAVEHALGHGNGQRQLTNGEYFIHDGPMTQNIVIRGGSTFGHNSTSINFSRRPSNGNSWIQSPLPQMPR